MLELIPISEYFSRGTQKIRDLFTSQDKYFSTIFVNAINEKYFYPKDQFQSRAVINSLYFLSK